jgi:riboflavin synthase
MFTGIIETLGTIQEIKNDKGNVHITVDSSITTELKISVAHNGICLTVRTERQLLFSNQLAKPFKKRILETG